MDEITAKVIAAIIASGIPTPPDTIVADGQLHHFRSDVEHDDKKGWYIIHSDGLFPAGAFGCFRRDIRKTWNLKDKTRKYTAEELADHKRRMAELAKQSKIKKEETEATASVRATNILSYAKEAAADNGYLVKKAVGSYGLFASRDGRLIVPIRDVNGALHSLQYIAADGDKQFLAGGRKKGCFDLIGESSSVFVIAEGYATAASIHEATGHAVVVAFDAGNLLPVATALREKNPFAAIIICADDDVDVEGNPGLTKAKEAARAIGASLAIPDFGVERLADCTDFNDLLKHVGKDAVAEQIKHAKLPEAPDATTEIERLSKLNYFEFERARKQEAKKLGIRATALDKFVAEKRPPKDKDKTSLGIFDPAPWPDPVDGADLLDEIYRLVERFLICTENERVAITLWTALTWFEEVAQVAPILDVSAATEACGKSTLLSVVMRLVKRPLSSVSISGPAIYRVIEKRLPHAWHR
jgi:putative DNA primase/helicase